MVRIHGSAQFNDGLKKEVRSNMDFFTFLLIILYLLLIEIKMGKIRISSTVSSIGRAGAVRVARASLAWCKKQFGVNNRKQYELSYSFIKGDENECGEYDAEDNKIYIYWSSLDNVEEIIKTCIHEWTHYKQPILTQYHKFKGGYSRHPFEKEANRYETEYCKPCWDSIRMKINKK